MATNAARTEPPQQLWLDVARPIQPAPSLRGRASPARRASEDQAWLGAQMELRMSARLAPLVAAPCEAPAVPIAKAPAPLVPEAPIADARPCFVTWLLGQSKSGGTVGELAKAARADRLFPRTGSAEEVRVRFDRAGADGDAYAALEDAERAYDRAA
jgi:hypothetical protein